MRPLIAVILAAATLVPSIAKAGPCSDEVTRFEQTVRRDERRPSAGATTRQSTAAQLHRQPTPQTVKEGEENAQSTFTTVLDRARAADAAGDESACRKALGEAKDMFDPL